MILYFSGTGNSEYAAKRISKEIDDKDINLFEKIRNNDYSKMYSERPWIIVTPTYAWRIPHVVEKWIENTMLTGSKDIYFIMTCGGSIGNASKYLEELCSKKKLDYHGCKAIIMPENYIAMFSTPNEDQASQIIELAETVIDHTAFDIMNNDNFPQSDISIMDTINSKIINKLFYPVFVHAKKFYATDDCISCGQCSKVCPLNNIHIKNGKPIWGDNCTHCMACICRCPKMAIEYGKHSKNLNRYVCPKKV